MRTVRVRHPGADRISRPIEQASPATVNGLALASRENQHRLAPPAVPAATIPRGG